MSGCRHTEAENAFRVLLENARDLLYGAEVAFDHCDMGDKACKAAELRAAISRDLSGYPGPRGMSLALPGREPVRACSCNK